MKPAFAARLSTHVADRHARSAERAFVRGPVAKDPAVEEAGEDFVLAVTGSEEGAELLLDGEIAEDLGGPFVEGRAAVSLVDQFKKASVTARGRRRKPLP